MPMIPEKDRKVIGDHFAKNLKQPLAIDYFTQEQSTLGAPIRACQYCTETGELLREVSALSDRITLREHDLVAEEAKAKALGVTRIPAILLSGAARGRVRFFGIPSGYEFSALIEDIVDVARGATDLSPMAIEELAGLKREVHIQVFSAPT
jgi:alkyl hydroperoxide reductase subunit AhpF